MSELFGADKPDEKQTTEMKVTKNEDGSFDIGGKHYKDTEALLESKVHADKHIETVLSEKKALEKTLQTEREKNSTQMLDMGGKLDMLLEHGYTSSVLDTETDGENVNTTQSSSETSQKIDPAAIAKMVKEGIDAAVKPLQDQLLVKEKQSEFRDNLIDRYGSKAKAKEAFDAFKEKTGFSEDFVTQMLLNDPQKAAEMITSTMVVNESPKEGQKPNWSKTPGLSHSGNTQHVDSTVNADGMGFKKSIEFMKTNPSRWTEGMQNQMSEDFDKLGDGYFGT